jgi:uncharacterized protein involved in exopolysaccharide biosynthesis
MARHRRTSPPGRFAGLLGRRSRDGRRSHLERLEEKQRAAAEATLKWLSLLREMERTGETNEARYHQYFDAYLQAKQQEKRADLEVFNIREGLVS